MSGRSLDEFDLAEVLSQLVDKSLVVADEDNAGVVPTIRVDPPVRAGAARGCGRRSRGSAGAPTATSRWLRRRGGGYGAGSGYAAAAEAAREIDELPCRARLGGRDTLSRPRAATRRSRRSERHDDRVRRDGLGRHGRRHPRHARASLVPARCFLGDHGGRDSAPIWSGPRSSPRSWKLSKPRSEAGNPQRAKDPRFWDTSAATSKPCLYATPRDWVARAREADDSYELGHTLIMHGTALQASSSDADQGVAVLEEAVRIGRDAGIASVLSIGLTAYAGSLPIDSLDGATHALALLDEAIDVGMTIGDKQAVASAQMTKASIATRLGHWAAALPHDRRSGRAFPPARRHAAVGRGLLDGRLVVRRVGSPRARSCPRGRNRYRDGSIGQLGDLVEEPRGGHREETILAGIGEQRLAELRERGASLENAELVAYLRAEVDGVIAER